MTRPGHEPRTPGTIQRTTIDRMLLPPAGTLGTLGDPAEAEFASRLRTQLLDAARMNMGAYAREAWRLKLLTAEETDALVLLVEKFLHGGWRKRGELRKGEALATEDLETYVVDTWDPGRYRLTPEWRGKEYAPRSRVYDVGDDLTAGPGKKDTDALIADAAEKVGQAVTLSNLKRLEAPAEEDGMKIGDLAALITALRTGERAGPDPLVTELLRQNQDAQRAILDELKALRDHGARQPGELAALLPALAPMLGTLLKPFARNPDALVGLLGRLTGAPPPAVEKGWVDGLLEVLAPALQSPTMQTILHALAQRIAATPGPVEVSPAALAPSSFTGIPEEIPMPTPLNSEQAEQVAQLVQYVMTGDFANGYACLELFPQSDPFPQAPLGVNLAEIWLARLDQVKRTADARVAVPSLRSLAPGLDIERAAEFIAYVMQKLRDEEDRAVAAAPPEEPAR